jgi:hypothetical protein
LDAGVVVEGRGREGRCIYEGGRCNYGDAARKGAYWIAIECGKHAFWL